MNMFWLVWKDGGKSPTYKHDTYDAARQEAERLSILNPCERFHVLELRCTASKDDVLWEYPDDPLEDPLLEGWLY